MKLTDALLGEHGVFYSLFDLVARRIEVSSSVAELKGTAAALEQALVSHANLEDELLLSSLDRTPAANGPVPVMRSEHEHIEGLFESVRASDSLEGVKANLSEILEVSRAHFAKEERVLFPMAGSLLGDEALEELGARWAQERTVSL